mgnify:CR=1 FL=1
MVCQHSMVQRQRRRISKNGGRSDGNQGSIHLRHAPVFEDLAFLNDIIQSHRVDLCGMAGERLSSNEIDHPGMLIPAIPKLSIVHRLSS